MKTLSARLNYILRSKGISQSELARRIGIKQQSISLICSGKSAASRYTPQISEALEVNAHWLATGRGEQGWQLDNVTPAPEANSRVPIINWVQAASWTEIIEGTHYDAEQWFTISGKVNNGCFALVVTGDSMENPGGKQSVPEGARIIVDPSLPYSSGSLVIAKMADSNEATFKQYIIDGGIRYLKPLNKQYPTIRITDNCTIIGVVTQAIMTTHFV